MTRGVGADEGKGPLGVGYWRLWTASGLSNLADGVVKVALPLAAVDMTRSPMLIAGLAIALGLPWLLFALPAGALADRLDRRRAMLGANLTRAALLTALTAAVVLDWGSIWVLYVVGFGLGIAETLYDTSAQSIVPQLVAPGQLPRANGRLYAAELTANEFVGPPLAGFLVAAGVVAAFVAPVGLWAMALLALLLVRGSFRVAPPAGASRTTLRADIVEGLRFLARHRLLRTLAAMVGGINFAMSAVFAVFVLYAVGGQSAMGLSEQGFGVLMTTFAAGSLAGSLVTEWAQRVLGRARSLALTVLVTAVALGAPAVTANPYAVGAAFFVGGTGTLLWNVVTVSLRQRITPARLLGRLNSCYRLVAWGTMPLGAVTGGVLVELVGFRVAFGLLAALVLLELVAMRVVTDAAMDAAEREAERREAATETAERRP